MRDRADFQRAFARKRAVSDAWFVVHAVENELAHARLGIAVPKKVARRAVSRHRMKRLVREVFRQNKQWFPAGCDLVVVARVGAATYARVEQSLRELATQIARRLELAPGEP